MELQIVRHHASAVRERHRGDPRVRGVRLVPAEDDQLVTSVQPSEQLADVRPNTAPDPTVLGSGHRDLRLSSLSTIIRLYQQQASPRPDSPEPYAVRAVARMPGTPRYLRIPRSRASGRCHSDGIRRYSAACDTLACSD